MKNKSILIIVLAALAVSACSTAMPTVEPAAAQMSSEPAMDTATPAGMDTNSEVAASEVTVSFSQDVWPIIEKYALAAHGGKGGVFLESYDDIMKYVIAGDPENSMLYKALIGDGTQRMPPDAPLPDEMIQTIYDWIAQGALNN